MNKDKESEENKTILRSRKEEGKPGKEAKRRKASDRKERRGKKKETRKEKERKERQGKEEYRMKMKDE